MACNVGTTDFIICLTVLPYFCVCCAVTWCVSAITCVHPQAVFNDDNSQCTVSHINYKINSGIPELFYGAYGDCQILKFRCKLLYRVIKKSLCTWRLQYKNQVHRDFLITLYYASWKYSGIQLVILFKICDCILSSLSSGPRAYASDALQPIGLLYDPCPTVIFRHSHFRRQVPPRPYAREILAVKGGTVGKNVGQ